MKDSLEKKHLETVFSELFTLENPKVQYLFDQLEQGLVLDEKQAQRILASLSDEQIEMVICCVKRLGFFVSSDDKKSSVDMSDSRSWIHLNERHALKISAISDNKQFDKKQSKTKTAGAKFSFRSPMEEIYFDQVGLHSLISEEQEKLVMEHISILTNKIKKIVLSCPWSLKEFDSFLKSVYDLSLKEDVDEDGSGELVEWFKLWAPVEKSDVHVNAQSESASSTGSYIRKKEQNEEQCVLVERMAIELRALKQLSFNKESNPNVVKQKQDELIATIDELNLSFEFFEQLALDFKEMIRELMFKKCYLLMLKKKLKQPESLELSRDVILSIKRNLKNEVCANEKILDKPELLLKQWFIDLSYCFNQINQLQYHLVISNLRLVIYIANKCHYLFPSIPINDLIQEGNLGLLRAAKLFDPRKGRFANYASWWIYQKMSQGISTKGFVRVSRDISLKLRELSKAIELIHQSAKHPNINLLSHHLGWSEAEVKKVYSYHVRTQKPISFEFTVDNDDDTHSLADMIADENNLVEEEANANDVRMQLDFYLNGLSYRERQILKFRHGLLGGSSHSLNQIAKKFGISSERVRQVEQRAIKKLTTMAGFSQLKKILV